MSKENSNSNSALQYVDQTVLRLQKSVKTTAIVTVALLLLQIIYFTYINNRIASDLPAVVNPHVETHKDKIYWALDIAGKMPEHSTYEQHVPKAHKILDSFSANEIASLVKKEIRTQENMIAQYSSELLQENLGNLPEWVQTQIPKYSGRLQERVDLWINQFCVASSDELGSTFDTFLESNGDQIRAFSEATDDELALEKLDEELTAQIAVFMSTTSLENYGTLEEQSNLFLSRLKAANELLKPLANKKTEELTEDQRQLRRAIGIFMNRVDEVNLNK
tara:strand:- start:1533 stop:2366 length:834 start_codon:yes stop_codon:yes gene_type:complete